MKGSEQVRKHRPVLTCAPVLALLMLLHPGRALADGAISVRTAYYREPSTRVVQPMIDAELDVTPDLLVDGHLLVDSITSASASAGDAFEETRVQGGAGLLWRTGMTQLGGFARYSGEPDYKSWFGGVRAAVELAQRNTTLAVTLGLGRDAINNAGARDVGLGQALLIEGSLKTLLASLSVTQILTPHLVAGLTYDLAALDGFLENPYRLVDGAGMAMPERVPDQRRRHAVLGSVRGHVPGARTTIIAGYRYYTDDWGIRAHTPELRLVQEITPALALHLRFRHHDQNGASFYRDIYDTLDPALEPYITSDNKLRPFTAQLYGIKTEYTFPVSPHLGTVDELRLDASFDYVVQNNRFENALQLQVGLTIPFDT